VGDEVPFALGELVIGHGGPSSWRNEDLQPTPALLFLQNGFALDT
jgi:hypothetical protein